MSEVSSMRLERTFTENHHCYYDYASQLCSWVRRRRRGRVPKEPQEDRKMGPEEKNDPGVPHRKIERSYTAAHTATATHSHTYSYSYYCYY